jgi:hypothetical protein
VGQVLLNTQKLDWREGDSLEVSMRKSFGSNRFYARALLDPTRWRRAIRGEVNVRAVMGIVRERLLAHARAELRTRYARLLGRAEPQTDVERAFHAIARRGTDTLFVFGFSDGGIDYMEQHLGRGARKMRDYHNFRCEIMDGADHTFTPVSSQAALYDLVIGHVTSRFP